MPPSKKNAPSASISRNAKAKAKTASPYNKNAKGGSGPTATNNNKKAHLNKPTQARNKHLNTNLTSELDSLLGDLNSTLQRKKTKRDARLETGGSGAMSEAEIKLNEAQKKHESLQNDMISALDGISTL
ncbi:hypothetical protein BC939DRAFT_480626 [Gamsiella multidivaricata]|uniref:uncharacterized protein n=1 Tax=Gamsiella multidivaricata TaxID=101098 RepID=UPI00221FCE4E|nr:uncharacterized protein BC939DRAFT_480626 [Gamsiella multidivaricata]KAI7818064.1 hypothetical protein BC939DRAFT_480626 [Gamsiella multidivaricata]